MQENEEGVRCEVGEVVGGELLESRGHGRRVGDGVLRDEGIEEGDALVAAEDKRGHLVAIWAGVLKYPRLLIGTSYETLSRQNIAGGYYG